jgi:hypothetical protein
VVVANFHEDAVVNFNDASSGEGFGGVGSGGSGDEGVLAVGVSEIKRIIVRTVAATHTDGGVEVEGGVDGGTGGDGSGNQRNTSVV